MDARKPRTLVLALAIGLSGTAQAALQGRDLNGSTSSFEAYYDTELNITWLADANLASSNTFGVSGIYGGRMTWPTANTWVAAMNASNYFGYHDWRLPTSTQNCNNYNCTQSELGHLFYIELGGKDSTSIASKHNANYSLFKNLASSQYWSGTPYTGGLYRYAWAFDFGTGYQYQATYDISFYALAVHPGDIAAVPEPESYAMMLAGLALVSVVAGRRRG